MRTGFQFNNMLPPEEALPNGTCESKCLVDELSSWFTQCTGETMVFDFPRRQDSTGDCVLEPQLHPRCKSISCPAGKECRQQWINHFGLANHSPSIDQWQCPEKYTVLVGSICNDHHLLGFGKVLLPQLDPMHLSLIKSAVQGTLREMELAIENSILKHKLESDRQQVANNNSSGAPESPGKKHPAVVHAMKHIHEHYHDHTLSLATVADAVGISACYLSSLFRENAGITFHEQVRTLRLANARELMETTNLPRSEIARRCGFSTLRNLRRAMEQAEASKN
ncbi:AraC family transcriptional regulator [Pontiellaceae bacterium B12227]|nr:AraC family transcriptional regulator [Pontiellaceae bacterium B12227]